MLLPALQASKEKGKAADCVNNLRQVHLAFAMFADDNDDSFPHTDYWWRALGSAGCFGAGQVHGGVTTPGPSGWEWNVDNPNIYQGSGCGGACYYMFRHPGKTANVVFLDGHVGTWRHKNDTGRATWVDVWLAEPN
jgi:prepilin-type processing-associated H-X9-DG protein